MKLRPLTSLAALLLAGAAHAAPSAPSYAVISLVGDKLDVITYQPQVGSQVDTNTHMLLPLSQDDLDTAALRAIYGVLHEAAPGAPVALLAASAPGSFLNQDRIFSGDHVTLPADIDAAVRREGASMLVLVTKHHANARLQWQDGNIGRGNLEGLGYYLDTDSTLRNRATGERFVGYIAPFAYVQVTLVDLASSTIVRQAAISAGQVIPSSVKADAVHPWDALSGAEKVDMLKSLLTDELRRVVPKMLSGEPARAG